VAQGQQQRGRKTSSDQLTRPIGQRLASVGDDDLAGFKMRGKPAGLPVRRDEQAVRRVGCDLVRIAALC